MASHNRVSMVFHNFFRSGALLPLRDFGKAKKAPLLGGAQVGMSIGLPDTNFSLVAQPFDLPIDVI